ncbi:MAG: thioesterase [Roseburia sp.]|nr:thioesterase [Roseburia sp.]
MMEEKIGRTELVVDPFHTDFAGRLNYGTLGKHLLNSAENHACGRGFGMKVLNEANYTWVLSRLVIEMYEMPEVYDKFCIDTWIENVYRLFCDRNFRIQGENGKVFGYARSIWAMINYDSREPIDLHEVHGQNMDKYICTDTQCPVEKQGKVRPLSDDMLVRTVNTKYSDIDYNGHVNSIKYIEHICDLFPLEKYRDANVRRIEMAYMAESYIGDTLSFFMEEKDNGTYHVEIRKNYQENVSKGEPVVRCKLVFE